MPGKKNHKQMYQRLKRNWTLSRKKYSIKFGQCTPLLQILVLLLIHCSQNYSPSDIDSHKKAVISDADTYLWDGFQTCDKDFSGSI